MTTTILTKESVNKELRYYLINTLFITNILFFIDEGYNDFRWMSNVGNWIIFIVYVLIIFGIQTLLSQVILRRFISQNKRIISILIGTIIGIALLTIILFTNNDASEFSIF